MLQQLNLDPTAGERARRLREHPTAVLPILDPTDPRCGLAENGQEGAAGDQLDYRDEGDWRTAKS